MAAIEIPNNGRSTGRSNAGRLSTRVDMTPMVDLGFLLITFFMLATTMSKPTSMSVFVPDKTTDDTGAPIRESNTLTLFLGKNDEIYYLDGMVATDDEAAKALKTARPGYDVRNVIFAAQRRANALVREGENDRFTVVIKPTAVSSYKNMVDILDEMAITKSNRYALVDKLTEAEAKLLGDRIE